MSFWSPCRAKSITGLFAFAVVSVLSSGWWNSLCAYDSLEIRYAGESSRMPVGSDIIAMGGNGIVLPRHPHAALWNPAAAAFLDRREFSGELADIYGGLSSQGCGALSLPFPDGLGASLLYVPFLSGAIDLNDTLPGTYQERLLNQNLRSSGSSAGTFENNHHLVLVSIARKISRNMPRPPGGGFPLPFDIGVGFSFKSAWQTMNPGSTVHYSMNVNLDAGIIARLGLDYDLARKQVSRHLLLGASFRDVVPSPVVWIRSRDEYNTGKEYEEAIQPSFLTGIAFVDKSGDLGAEWTLTAGVERQYKTTYHYGVEALVWNIVAFRGGFSNRNPALGAGIYWKQLYADYAFTFEELAMSPFRLTLGTRF